MKHVLPLLAVALAATACLNERVYMDPTQNASFGGGRPASNMNLQDGHLRGDFGPRRGFDGAAQEMQGSSDPEWRTSTVTLTRNENARGTGMVILWTNGIVLENLEVGSHDYAYDESSLDAPPVSANVCSGPDSASIDYDRPADQVTINVSQTPEGRQYDLHTETVVVDEGTGERTDRVETSDTTFLVGAPAAR
jgi:hypothetical protein